MTLNKYVNELLQFIKDNPEGAEWNVITSSDDEGNDFNIVSWGPTAGHYEDREFYSGDDLIERNEDLADDGEELIKINAVCIN